MFIVYRTTNIVTFEFYIGVHKATRDDGYLGSGRQIKHAVAVYGAANFSRETLFSFPTKEAAYQKERELVEPLLTHPLCLNLHVGGRGGFDFINRKGLHETKSALAALKIKRSDPNFQKRCIINATNARLASEKWAESMRQRDSRTFSGRHHTDEAKRKMSEAHKGIVDGENNPSYGTCWIKHPSEPSIKIPLTELLVWVNRGWKRGRRMSRI